MTTTQPTADMIAKAYEEARHEDLARTMRRDPEVYAEHRRIAEGPKDTPARQIARRRLDFAGMPYVGQPATIRLYTDTRAAVVVKVNPKSVAVATVETTNRRQDTRCDGPLPVMVEDGVLDQIVGQPERYSKIVHSDGRVSFRNGSIGVTLGRSVSVTDYRF